MNAPPIIVCVLCAASQVEDCGGGGGLDPVPAGGGAAQADHRHAQGHAGPSGGAPPRLPQHRHQGQRAAAALPGLSEGEGGGRGP